jgi:hypothetical protein
MADLHKSTTSHPSPARRRLFGQGSPFAAELDRKLAGHDEPLIRVIKWWVDKYFEWRKTQPDPGEDGPSLMDLNDNETSVLTLNVGWSFPLTGEDEELTKVIMTPDVSPETQSAWDDLRQARATLRAKASVG